MKLIATVNYLDPTNDSTHIIGVYEGQEKHALYSDLLKSLAAADVFKGKKSSSYFVRNTNGNANVLLVGLGKEADATGETFRIAGAHIAKKLEGEKVKEAILEVDSFSMKAPNITALAEGALLSTYNFDLYKSEKSKHVLARIDFTVESKKSLGVVEDALDVADAIAEVTFIARDLSNEPGSVLVPMELAKRAQKYAREFGLTCKILDKKALAREKMNGILGVGQGSVNPPCLIVMEYKPKKAVKKKVAFVGKGVTFDSGGISIKPGANMEDMKHDMSGASTVLAATLLAARLKIQTHIICVIAAAENMPGSNAMIPSTILKARSGKTVEVQNTDAEGRLILMDALDYAQDYKPDAVIDAATLTGAVVMALSNVAAGIMGNDDKLMAKFKAAAAETEERFWELPLYQEYTDDIKSKIADIKNIGSSGSGAGSQKGGVFLKEFIRKDTKWIHVDIAGTAWNLKHLAYHPTYGASGHGIRTFVQLASDL
jgi:leucyl aminopeptidase